MLAKLSLFPFGLCTSYPSAWNTSSSFFVFIMSQWFLSLTFLTSPTWPWCLVWCLRGHCDLWLALISLYCNYLFTYQSLQLPLCGLEQSYSSLGPQFPAKWLKDAYYVCLERINDDRQSHLTKPNEMLLFLYVKCKVNIIVDDLVVRNITLINAHFPFWLSQTIFICQ